MEVDTVQDEDDCKETETEVGDCAEGSVLWLNEHGSEDECDTACGAGGALQTTISTGSIRT
jgi:hypothetical protein